jgi:formate hydrogenlyase subunit 3/multisubunit Na+/H+ antiporter MnhD subunit
LSNILLYIILLPLICGFISLFLPNRFRIIPKALALIVSAVTLFWAGQIFNLKDLVYSMPLLQAGTLNIDLLLASKPLGSFMLLFSCLFGLLITIYTLKTPPDVKRANEFYGSILLAVGGAAGILLTGNLLFLLIFWEIVTVSLYLLISSGGKGSNFAATKSFAMIGASDGALLLGILIVWVLSGTFTITDISLGTKSALEITAFLLLLTAALTKAGALPLHTWVPVSGEYAPVSVMALLPAAIDKLLGIYLLVIIVRQLFTINSAILTLIMAAIGAATIIIAVMIAMVQHNLKKLLSYHAVSQVGYMILGISTGTAVGIAGGLFHMLNNAIYKSCLFLCGGAAEEAAGTSDLEKLGGLGKKMPLTFTACLIAALSISGIPLFNGFVSKWMVYQGVIEMGSKQTSDAAQLWPVWLVAAMFGSALTLASFVKIIHSVFLSRLPDNLKDVKEASLLKTLPMLLLAGLCVFFGIFYSYPLKHLIYPALNIQSDNVIFGIWQSSIATYIILIGIILGIILLLIGVFARKVRIVDTWSGGERQSNEAMSIPGTHFYKTVSSMGGLKQLYSGQEKGYFDLYNISGKLGLVLTGLLRWAHTGVISTYVLWMMVGVLILLFAICGIW